MEEEGGVAKFSAKVWSERAADYI